MAEVRAVRRSTAKTVHAERWSNDSGGTRALCWAWLPSGKVVEVEGGAAQVTCGNCRRVLAARGEGDG